MIDNVPLIQNANDVQQINASIIAMKKASRELDEKIVKLNSLNSELDKKIALLDSGLNKEIEDRKEAINSLDVPSVGGSGKYISAISETDGKISATAGDITSSVSSGNSQPVTSGGVYNLTSTNTNTSKADANLCYSDSTRVEFFRLLTNASNCPPSNSTNPTYIEAFTFNNGTFIRVTQKAYDNYNGIASYIRSGNGTTNNITWSSWVKILNQSNVTDTVANGNNDPISSNAVYNELYYTTRAYQVSFAAFFTANTTVHIVDFVNAVVNKYGKGFKDLSFIWSDANQGYITDGVTSILMNGNFIRGYFTPIAEGYNWVSCQFLTYNINNGKAYIIEVKRDSSTISEHIYPLN